MTPKRTLAAVALAVLGAACSLTLGQEAPPPPPAAEAVAAVPLHEPDPAVVALQQAKDAFKKGLWAEAHEAAAKTLASQPKDLEALYIVGACERQSNRLVDAEAHLKTLIDASPLFPLAHFQLGYVLFLQAEGLARGGQAEPAKAKYVEAAGEFGRELARSPSHVASLSSRAIALSLGGQIDESVPAHEAWIAAVPQKNDPLVSLASANAAANRATEAMSALDRLPDKSVKPVVDTALATANIFIARSDWGSAIPFLEKAADTDPSSTRARGLLTEGCARAGLANDAARNLQTFLAMEPSPEEAEAVGEAIKTAMGDGTRTPPIAGVEPPAVVKVPGPKYPKGQDPTVETEVLVLALVGQDATVVKTLIVPNRIWKEIRTSGFETAAFDAVRRGRFSAGTKGGQPADLWVVVAVKFARF